MAIIDLHFHSTYSDGKMSVEELATRIKERKLKYCALTDHNTVSGVVSLQDCLKDSDITIIPGVELTALFGQNEIHVLAYDFDVNVVEKILEERNSLVKKQKINELHQITNLFSLKGLQVSDNLIPSNKKPVGYTLAIDICSKQFNQNIFLKRHGKILTPEDVYFEYQATGKSCAVARSGVSIEWLFSKLKNKVSDFVIAHPFLQTSVANRPLTKNDILSLLKMGISGLEIYHDKTSDDKIQWLKKICDKKKLNYTGGSDFHGRPNNLNLGLYGLDLEVPSFKLSNYQRI